MQSITITYSFTSHIFYFTLWKPGGKSLTAQNFTHGVKFILSQQQTVNYQEHRRTMWRAVTLTTQLNLTVNTETQSMLGNYNINSNRIRVYSPTMVQYFDARCSRRSDYSVISSWIYLNIFRRFSWHLHHGNGQRGSWVLNLCAILSCRMNRITRLESSKGGSSWPECLVSSRLLPLIRDLNVTPYLIIGWSLGRKAATWKPVDYWWNGLGDGNVDSGYIEDTYVSALVS